MLLTGKNILAINVSFMIRFHVCWQALIAENIVSVNFFKFFVGAEILEIYFTSALI